jgi:two-component system CheB/CheR fusion protein
MADTLPLEPLRVLIVDDCADTTSSLALLAQFWGHQAFVACNGAEALKLAAQHRPHVIFLDIAMPGLNGWELAPRLRELPGLEGVLLVVISGFGRTDDVRRSHEAGCDLHLTKPVPPQRLQDLLVACKKEKQKNVPRRINLPSQQPVQRG